MAKAAYKVIALKYRPQTFEDMAGQGHIKQALTGAISRNKIAHAFLFAGSRGTGKTTSARILAKALNCLAGEGPTVKPCGQCAACKEIAESRDMDVLEIDGASNNGVEQVRELLGNIENRPARDRFRVVIIDEVHMLSTAAFNALLKTLEEPPVHVKFIFATTDAHKVPETIHSRCQHYDFRRLTNAEIAACLEDICVKEGVKVDPGALLAIASISEGGMRDGQSKLDQLIAFRGETVKLADVEDVFGLVGQAKLVELLGLLRVSDARGVFTFVEDVFATGKDLRAFLVGLIGTFRDALLLATCGAEIRTLDMTGDARALLEKEAQQWSGESLVYSIDMLNECGRYLKASEYPRIALESTLYKLCHIGDLRSIDDVIAAVETLIAQGPASSAAVSGAQGAAPASLPPADKKKVLAADETALPATSIAVSYPQEGRSAPVPPPRPAPTRGELPESFAKAKALIQEVFNVSEEHLS